jgi:hypothetical protein
MMTSSLVSIELDELEDAVNDALLLLESTLGTADPALTETARRTAVTIAELLPSDHPLRERILSELRTFAAADSTASNTLLNLVNDLTTINEARLEE